MNKDRLSNIYYFVDEDNFAPVKKFINSLAKKEQAKIYAYINELKKQGNNLRRPMAGYLKKGIYELRPKDNRIFYFFYLDNKAVLVHAIKKNTKKIPEKDLKICIKRKHSIENKIGKLKKHEVS
jgi:phage-related protein